MEESNDQLCQVQGKVRDRNGLHLKVASEISRVCAKLPCRVKIARDVTRVADAKSPLALLTLGAAADITLKIIAEGVNARAAIQALEPFFFYLD